MRSFFNVFLMDIPELPPGVAFTRPGVNPTRILHSGRIVAWHGLVLDLKRGAFTDYMGSNITCRLCSATMRNVIESFTHEDPNIQWLDVDVSDGTSGVRRCSILHFCSVADVLDKNMSTFVPQTGQLIRPCLDAEKVNGLNVFCLLDGDLDLVVSEDVRDALIAARCTGIEFARVRQK
jgi:hypothetical protein